MANRYTYTNPKKDSDTNVIYMESTIYPKVEPKDSDFYIISSAGDRLDLLANKYYNDTRWWWIIARANNIGKGTLALEPGMQLRIPFPVFLGDIESKIEIVNKER